MEFPHYQKSKNHCSVNHLMSILVTNLKIHTKASRATVCIYSAYIGPIHTVPARGQLGNGVSNINIALCCNQHAVQNDSMSTTSIEPFLSIILLCIGQLFYLINIPSDNGWGSRWKKLVKQ